jgi:hypothetical protein
VQYARALSPKIKPVSKDKSSFCQSISGVPLAINQMSGEAAKSSRKVRDRKVYKGISTNV